MGELNGNDEAPSFAPLRRACERRMMKKSPKTIMLNDEAGIQRFVI